MREEEQMTGCLERRGVRRVGEWAEGAEGERGRGRGAKRWRRKERGRRGVRGGREAVSLEVHKKHPTAAPQG